MTKKHFQMFADALRNLRLRYEAARDDNQPIVWVRLTDVEELCASIFAQENSQFDRNRFYRACGRPDRS